MLKVLLPILLALALLGTGCQPASPDGSSTGVPPEGSRIGTLAPDFQLPDLDGQSVSLNSLRGKAVLLNFWATWCSPCRREMPYLQQIYEEWSGKGLVLLAIDIGEKPAIIERFLEANRLSLTVLLDSTQVVARQYNITSIPTTLFIDKDGVIKARVAGAFPSKEAIEQHLDKIVP